MSNDPEMQQIRNQITFGLDAEAFMQSTIGRYLTGRAHADIEDALERMKTVNPFDGAEVRTIQNEIHRAESFLLWMGQAVTEGENAARSFIEATD
jgi:hypothetical protein